MFDLMLIPALVSTSTVFALTRPPWIIYQQARVFRKKALRLLGILLLVALASCYLAQSTPPPHSRVPSRRVFLLSFSPDVSSRPAVQGSERSTDWPTYHHDNARTGYLAHELDPKRLLPAWTVPLDGAVYAEPLVIGEHVIAATEGDSLYSLDARTGRVQWRISIGHPVPLSTLNCRGTIDLLGITGTPVYDPVTGLVFAVAEVSGPKHLLVGVDVNTGKLRLQRPVDVPHMHPPWIYLQRPALALSHGMVYMAFGGLADDCGTYHGTIVASQTNGQGPLRSFQVPTQDSGGIWGPRDQPSIRMGRSMSRQAMKITSAETGISVMQSCASHRTYGWKTVLLQPGGKRRILGIKTLVPWGLPCCRAASSLLPAKPGLGICFVLTIWVG